MQVETLGTSRNKIRNIVRQLHLNNFFNTPQYIDLFKNVKRKLYICE